MMAAPRDVDRDELPLFARWRQDSGCPPPELLLPAIEGTLGPPMLAVRVRTHVERCRMCRELADSLAAAGEAVLTTDEIVRMDGRVMAATAAASRVWLRYAAAAALVLAAGLVAWTIQWDAGTRVTVSPVPPDPPAARREPQAEFVLALESPEIQLPPEALTLRSGSADPYATALERALEPFARNDYADAATRFAQLARDYPQRPHPLYYLGLSHLMRGAGADAVPYLERAQVLSGRGTSLYSEAAWYRAVALERSGRRKLAAGALIELCGGGGPRDAQACDGLRSLLIL
jgi:hypothetical protein